MPFEFPPTQDPNGIHDHNPNRFCKVCGDYKFPPSKKQQEKGTRGQTLTKITPHVRAGYELYYGVRMGDEDKEWAPKFSCCVCVTRLSNFVRTGQGMPVYADPIYWMEPTNHTADCFICTTKLSACGREVETRGTERVRRREHVKDGIPVPAKPTYDQFVQAFKRAGGNVQNLKRKAPEDYVPEPEDNKRQDPDYVDPTAKVSFQLNCAPLCIFILLYF